MNLVLITLTISSVDIQPFYFSHFDDAQWEVGAMPARTWIFISSPSIHENRDRFALLFFFGRLSRALRNITDELFVFVLGSFALQRRVTTKEEKRFTLTINNNESTRSMCLVTDIPHFPLFIFLAPLPPALVCVQAETRGWASGIGRIYEISNTCSSKTVLNLYFSF